MVLIASPIPLWTLNSSTVPFRRPAYTKFPSVLQHEFMHQGGTPLEDVLIAIGLDSLISHIRRVPSMEDAKNTFWSVEHGGPLADAIGRKPLLSKPPLVELFLVPDVSLACILVTSSVMIVSPLLIFWPSPPSSKEDKSPPSPLVIALLISSSSPIPISSSSPKRLPKLLVLSTGLPGASSSPSPLFVPTPLGRPLSRPPDTPFIKAVFLISCHSVEIGRKATLDICPDEEGNSRRAWPVFRSQS